MKDSAFIIFIIFGCVWVLMGIAAVIALLKADNQEIRIGKQGLIITMSIVLPLILALAYQAVKSGALSRFT
ncbi:MAG: hypothetical protein KME16_08495 [Scytolyngbya sp. HA4215-MV1]|jgi:uncharacterized membrane protein HdeD (DUF308 family)|nr:hypothetical protein [Scytolyngbya sp. HA4215-MV1]